MKTKLRIIMTLMASALMLSGCQTPIQNSTSINQIGNTIYMPNIMVSIDSDGNGVPDDLDMCPDTQENAVVDERGCHITTGPDMSLKMEIRVFFAKGSSELLSRYHSELDNVGRKMLEFDTAIMRIEGSISANEIDNSSLTVKSSTLSKNRALIVKNYLLLKHGIKPSRLTTLNCDARAPIAPNDTKEGRHMNRRVYGVVFKPEEQEVSDYPNVTKLDPCIEF